MNKFRSYVGNSVMSMMVDVKPNLKALSSRVIQSLVLKRLKTLNL